jgi:hypothetical protein
MSEEIELQQDETPADESISLREELENAFKDAREKPTEEEAKPAAETTGAPPVVPEQPQPSVEKVSPPNSWTAAAKAKWEAIDADLRAEIIKRETEMEKGFTKFDEERSVGKTFKEVLSPYMPMIQAEGGTPITAVQSLLNTAYQLRTATPQAKGQLLMELARQYGADFSQVSQSQPAVDPQLQAIHQELAQLKNARQQELTMREQQEQAAVQSTISSFAADPKNVHFESVRAEMAALLQAGRAKDLQEAYDMAVWAKPDIRSTLLQQQIADAEAKRVAEAKAKAAAARKASGSVTGSPGATAPKIAANQDRSLREELEAQLAAARNS